MKLFCFILCIATSVGVANAQTKYFTKSGTISFYSKAPLEDIEAHNSKAVSVFDTETGQTEFSVLIKGFEFEKAKMQEHFNEDYLESDKYPKAVFNGTMTNAKDVNLTKNGVYNIDITGSLIIHGITKPQNAKGVITVRDGNVSAESTLTITLADYNIRIPSLVAGNIGKTVKITINVASYQPLISKS